MSSSSIQEVRANISSYVRRAEGGEVIKITRRGHEVAVLLSRESYERLIEPKRGLMSALESFHERYDADGEDHVAFDELRERSEGREVSFD